MKRISILSVFVFFFLFGYLYDADRIRAAESNSAAEISAVVTEQPVSPAGDPNQASAPAVPPPGFPNAGLNVGDAKAFLEMMGGDPNLAEGMGLPSSTPLPSGITARTPVAALSGWQPGFNEQQPVSTQRDGSAGFDWFGQLASAGTNQAEPEESINLNNVEMRIIVQKLGDWTGKPIIPTTDEVLQKRITIYASQKVPRSRALSLVYAALRARGVIAEHAEDKIFLKPIAEARQGYVPTLGPDDALARIEDKNMIVEKFFRLKSYDATRLSQIITPLIAEYGHVTALANTNDVVVIDTVENLTRIERIVRQLDIAESEQVVEQIFEIQNGDPAEIVQLLQIILSGGTQSSGGGQDRSRGRPSDSDSRSSRSEGRPGATTVNPASTVTISTEIPIRLIPMPKQNWIIARASERDMDLIESWIKKLDISQSTEQGQSVIPVRYVDPREVARAVQSAIEDMPGTQFEASIVVEALTQSKQIVVWGSEENRKMVERLVAEIDLPGMDIFIERTFKLNYADPDQIKTNIDGLYGELSSRTTGGRSYNIYGGYSSYGSSSTAEDTVKVIAYPTLRQVTVIASEKNMQKIAKQITEEWDVPLDISKDQYRLVTLHNSDPVQMAQLLSTLFSATDSGSSNNLIRMIMGGRVMEDEKSKIVGSLYGMFTFEPVPNTKKIIIISKIPEAYDVIEKLIKDLDSEEKAELPQVITLNYADAEDLCDQLNALLNEPGTTATLQRSTRGLSEYSADTGSSVAGQEDQSAGTITPWWNRQTRTTTTEEMPTSNLIGKIRFIPVHRSKAILVLAPSEYMEDIRAMVKVLDQPGMQVMVKVVIMTADHSNIESLGVKYSTNQQALGDVGVDALRALGGLIRDETRGNTILSFDTQLYALVDLLVSQADAQILNQPTLWTKDNKEAAFIKAQEIAFLEQSQTDSSNPNSVVNSYNYRDVGITLRVRPNITPEKDVDMTINLEISEVGPDINGQVSTNKLDTTTSIIVKNGQTIILGGILTQKDSKVLNKVPLLGDIPILGEAFKHTDNELTNSELLVFVTPYVFDDENLQAIPADTDSMKQLEQPRKRMDTILSELDQAIQKALFKNEMDFQDKEGPDIEEEKRQQSETGEVVILPEPVKTDSVPAVSGQGASVSPALTADEQENERIRQIVKQAMEKARTEPEQ
ncbi:MAG: hypothetical protein JW828_08335 [Sedimentisphaerales bacterium]|nr:hypothetical protein [Sedimentisphaerales bacterium]